MEVIYVNYEPDRGYEEAQVKIYTEVSGLPATADELRIRLNREGRDHKTVRYAFSKENEPLAYIQAVDSGSRPGRYHVSYPWALPGCPAGIQDQMFDEMLEYIKSEKKPLEIAVAVVARARNSKEMIEFFKRKGFVENERIFWFHRDMDVIETSEMAVTSDIESFTCRKATIDDLDTLFNVCQKDPQLSRALPTKEASDAYFRDRVLQDGHAVIIYDGDKAVAASAPLRVPPEHPTFQWNEERIIMRFTAIDPEYQVAWKKLLIEVARECKKAGWSDIPIRCHFYFFSGSLVANSMAGLLNEIDLYETVFVKENV